MKKPPLPLRLTGLLISLSVFAMNLSAASDEIDLTTIPFEKLLQKEVSSASKMARQVSDSPSAVAIVTADDIRAYGYRSLADVINSMRGLYTTYDRRYEYLGGRGFGKPGDYTGRIMLLVDGYATQDNLYNQAYIDNSGLLDMELIERVEYVPGTGSVTYGNNALLGIINVVTKKGRDFNGTQFSTELASYGGRKQRVTFGKQLENGTNILLSASEFDSNGQNLYFPGYDTPAKNHGWANGLDFEKSQRLFAKIEHEGLTLESGFVSRKKALPHNPNKLTQFNSLYQSWDENAYLSAKYETDLSLQLKSATHFYHGEYQDKTFRQFVFDPLDPELYRQNRFVGQWWGVDQKFVADWFSDHYLVFGFEFRNDFRQKFLKEYLTSSSALNRSVLDQYARQTRSLYAADEYTLNTQWKINFGGRYDKASDARGHISPRLALIHTPTANTTWKASYSEAFRLPSANDKYSYPTLARPEQVKSLELVLQHQFTPRTRFTGSAYQYFLSNLTYTDTAGNEFNTGASNTHGLEMEIEESWHNGTRLRSSIAFQNAVDVDGRDLVNSPNVLGKFNLTFPMLQNSLRTGFELQYLGPRLTFERRKLEGTALANLTFSSERKWYGLSASFSIRNVFDKNYDAVWAAPSTITDGTLQMDGRNYWFQLSYNL